MAVGRQFGTPSQVTGVPGARPCRGNALAHETFGILIDERNKVSLSRLQATVWTVIIVSGFAAIGLGQRHRDGAIEPPLATIGQDLSFLPDLVSAGRDGYKAADVVAYLLQAPRDQTCP